MLNRKIELLGALLFWALMMWFLQTFVLKTSPSPVEVYCSVASSLFITTGVLFLYQAIRNHHFIKKLYMYVCHNDLTGAQILVEKTLKKQPKVKWLMVERCILLGLSGDLAKFHSAFTVLIKAEKLPKNFANLQIVSNAIDLIQKRKICFGKKSNKYVRGFFSDVHDATSSFLENNFETATVFASKSQQSNIVFCLLFSAYLLSEIYTQAKEYMTIPLTPPKKALQNRAKRRIMEVERGADG